MEAETKTPKGLRFKKPRALITAFAILLIIAVVAVGLILTRSADPIPKDISQTLNFSLYYPSKLPRAYYLDESSVRQANGILFFTIKSAQSQMNVSEQSKPAKPPNLANLTKPQQLSGPTGVAGPTLPASFHFIDSPAGQAVEGTELNGNPAAIILTPTTLINISGSSGLPTTDLNLITQHFDKLN